ncbi:MAG: mycothiol system anti-sigma-R factor [Propionibacteriales bacterium]|nr:mycothiol system anti-sigma-R factor [Propionibacteriales bacterium]
MSCGKPHEKPCSEVLRDLFLFLDREMEEASCGEIQRHLDECGPCLQKYELEQLVKSLVARSCDEHAPDTLRERVLYSIRHVQVELSQSADTSQLFENPRRDPWL